MKLHIEYQQFIFLKILKKYTNLTMPLLVYFGVYLFFLIKILVNNYFIIYPKFPVIIERNKSNFLLLSLALLECRK